MKKIIWLIAFIFNSHLILNNAYPMKKLSNSVTISGSKKSGNVLYDFNLDLNSIKVNSTFTDKNCNVSAGFTLEDNKIPWSFELLTGNLSNYGIFSKLNAPVLSSSVSPFSNAQTEIIPLKASHAGKVFSAPLSIITALEYKNKDRILSKAGNQFLMIYADMNKGDNHLPLYASNSYAHFKINDSTLSLSFYAGLFPFYHKNQTSWFSEPYYSDNRSFDSLFQTGFSNKSFSSVFTVFFYTNPFAELQTAFKSENSLSVKNMIFNLSAFLIPGTEIFTSASKTYESQLLLKGNFQIKNPVPHFSFGSTTFAKIDLYDREHYIKNSSGIKINKNNFSLNTSINSKLIMNKKDFSQYKIQFSDIDLLTKLWFNTNFISFTLNTNVYFDFTEDYKAFCSTEKINARLDFKLKDSNEKINLGAETTVEFLQDTKRKNKTKINSEFEAQYLLNSFYSISLKILISSL
ncbi:MAG: hypothetical protein IKX23_09670 [Treponema sp.]|nr:hypothetical protein [Treponema sp.]